MTETKTPASRLRILYISHDLRPKRGGNVVAAWMLQALATEYAVTVLSWQVPDLEALDRRFGTDLAHCTVEYRTPGAVERWLVEQIPDDSDLQCCNYLLRCARPLARDFAAVIACTSLESDFGVRGIQYVHYPYMARHKHLFDMAGDAPLLERLRGFVTGRLPPWMLISGYSFHRMRANLTLTNSEWTRNEIRRGFDLESHVVYPPAEGGRFSLPWEQREDGFMSIGWFEKSKRHSWIIETLAEVRSQHPGLRLHLCGSRVPSALLSALESTAREHGSWVQIHYDLSNDDLLKLAGRQRYAIHGMINEHFGIAPALCARAGCIPFVHDSGGQVEIVNHDPRLCYTTREDAVAKILAMLRDGEMRAAVRAEVQAGSDRFSAETFIRAVRHHVAEFIAGRA